MKSMDELVAWFQTNFPIIVSEMRKSSHHGIDLNPYHLEGTIFEHTLMVCQNARHSDPTIQLAALLHDIGKPIVRYVNPKNNHVYFTSHEAVSAYMALDVMKKVDWLTPEEKILVFRAICHHTDVFKLTKDQLETNFTNEPTLAHMVRELSICDHLGRFTSKPTELVEFSYKFREPRPKKDKDLIIMTGLPCSGKSTRSKELKEQGYVSLSSDEIIEELCPNMTYNEAYKSVDHTEVEKLFLKRLEECRKLDKVVVDTTNLSKKRRKNLIDKFRKTHNIKGEVLLVPPSELLRRNEERAKQGKNIPMKVYDQMVKSFTCPNYGEGYDELEWKLYENCNL